MDTFRLWKQRGIEMFVKEVAVQNQVGLHARPATFFIQKANEYKSSIWVEKEERRVNAKSLLGVLSLGIPALFGDMRTGACPAARFFKACPAKF